eukprot:9838877-Lingulodinium_polyedra.AAC.1
MDLLVLPESVLVQIGWELPDLHVSSEIAPSRCGRPARRGPRGPGRAGASAQPRRRARGRARRNGRRL